MKINFWINKYNDVVVRLKETHGMTEFCREVLRIIDRASMCNNNAIWFEVPSKLSFVLPCLYDLGFLNHHCGNTYLMLTKWLRKDHENKLPEAGTHEVRVEVVVESVKDECVLLVRERYSDDRDHWKPVSGWVERGEFVDAAARRELKEEVGIRLRKEKAKFLGLGNRRRSKFNNNEMIVGIRFEVENNMDLRVDKTELADARWFPKKEAYELLGSRDTGFDMHWLTKENTDALSFFSMKDYNGRQSMKLIY